MWKKTLSDFEKCDFFYEILHCFLKVRNAQFTLVEKPHMKINSLKNQKHVYLIHTWSDVQNW